MASYVVCTYFSYYLYIFHPAFCMTSHSCNEPTTFQDLVHPQYTCYGLIQQKEGVRTGNRNTPIQHKTLLCVVFVVYMSTLIPGNICTTTNDIIPSITAGLLKCGSSQHTPCCLDHFPASSSPSPNLSLIQWCKFIITLVPFFSSFFIPNYFPCRHFNFFRKINFIVVEICTLTDKSCT